MNVIKRHMGLAIVLGLSLMFVVVLLIIVWPMIFGTGAGEYGNRLDGIVSIKDSTLKDVESSIKENESVEKASVRIQGKIIYTTIYVKEGTSKSSAKEMADKVVEKFDDEVKKDYDFGFLIHETKIVKVEVKKEETEEDKDTEKKETEEEKEYKEEDQGFTIAGTKHPEKTKISWTKD